ncbi:STAS-like domain-containing protein [Staphylococcus pseudoxylosus]|uniref:STAS-like domain-containing protein n=1 Tax=Staphylococcus pseudoxylosus TaxID=2282419 RepID=UPI003F565101
MGRVINVLDFIDSCSTNEQGEKIKGIIERENNEKIQLSFQNVDGVTSSFVNSLFVNLMVEKGILFIKNNINIINSNSQINNLILKRLKFEKENRIHS